MYVTSCEIRVYDPCHSVNPILVSGSVPCQCDNIGLVDDSVIASHVTAPEPGTEIGESEMVGVTRGAHHQH